MQKKERKMLNLSERKNLKIHLVVRNNKNEIVADLDLENETEEGFLRGPLLEKGFELGKKLSNLGDEEVRITAEFESKIPANEFLKDLTEIIKNMTLLEAFKKRQKSDPKTIQN